MPGKVHIKKIKTGKNAGQFRFVLKGDNGENLSPKENYTQKHNVTEVLKKYFPGFEIVDETRN